MAARAWLRTATAATATASSLVAGADPASALVVPRMGVTVSGEGTSAFTLCGYGTSSATINHWRLTVAGVRTAGGAFTAPVIESTAATFHECLTVPKGTSTAGVATVTLTFAGAGTDVIGSFSGYARWAQGQEDATFESGIT